MICIGPVLLTAVGDRYVEAAHIEAVVWEGATTAGDTCEITCPASGALLFAGRAAGAQTWQSLAPTRGVSAPHGFQIKQLSAGRVLVYLREA